MIIAWNNACLALLTLALSLFTLTGCSSDTASKHYAAAEELLGNGEYMEAVAKYDYVVTQFQDSPYAPKSQYRIASIYNRYLNDKKRATDAYYTLNHIYPKSPEAVSAREDMAEIYSDAGEHAKAVEQYQWVAEKRPKKAQNYRYLIAMEYLKMNDLRQARIELQDLLKLPLHTELLVQTYYQIANTYYLEGDSERAIDAYDKLILEFPDHSLSLEARLNKARALEESERFTDALAILRSLEGRYPNREAIAAMIEWIEKRLKEGPGQSMERRWQR